MSDTKEIYEVYPSYDYRGGFSTDLCGNCRQEYYIDTDYKEMECVVRFKFHGCYGNTENKSIFKCKNCGALILFHSDPYAEKENKKENEEDV